MNSNKKVAFYTLGCKLNFSETSTIARNFEKENFKRIGFDEKADIYVINTCSVTENADKRFKTIVKNVLKQNEDAFIIAIGCYAQLKPEALADVNGVDLVLGATEKFKVTSYINDLTKNEVGEVHSCDINEANIYESSFSFGDRTRAFLKVQDGCDYKCTYCTIPLARGISRSDTVENVLKNAKEIASKDIKEIVLTGVNIGDFGKGSQENFYELLLELEKVEGIERIRISSIEPELLSDEIIELVAQSKVLLPHFHLPLQSGCDKILKDMKRFYNTALYAGRVEKIKSLMPDACIAADLIVGFPTETDDDFAQTKQFIADLPISYVHVFSYSQRENTKALRLQNVVSIAEKKKRSQRLHELSERKRMQFYRDNRGSLRRVLWESEEQNGMMSGWTENYIKVVTPYQPNLKNTIQEVRLEVLNADGVFTV